MKKRILTGDRPTGPLHLGHYVGTMMNRVRLQHDYDTIIMVADVQALSTHHEHPEMLAPHVHGITLDYLSLGLDPESCTFFVQSMVPDIAELAMYFSMFVTVSSLQHNPTIKTEIRERGYEDGLSYGFLGYPVSQAADITFCKADLVPVGPDQAPLVELARKIVRRFNALYSPVLVEPELLLGELLIGLDGESKMSKSKGNCIYLTDPPDTVHEKVMGMYTDPTRLRATDPGHVENNPVFIYHDALNPDKAEVEDLKACYRQGRVGDVVVKERLRDVINTLLEPVQARRAEYTGRPGLVAEILEEGTFRARQLAAETLEEVREAMGMQYFTDPAFTCDGSLDYV